MEISTLSLSTHSASFSTYHRIPPTSSLASSRSSNFNPSNTIYNHKKALALSRPVVDRKRGLSFTCLFGLGVPELVVIAGVAVLLFGPKQLPGVGRNIGKTIKSFQQAAKEFETELKKEPNSITEPSPSQTPTASVSEVEKQDATVSSSKDSS